MLVPKFPAAAARAFSYARSQAGATLPKIAQPCYFLIGLRGPLRVRALFCVRWPFTGRPRRWRMPR